MQQSDTPKSFQSSAFSNDMSTNAKKRSLASRRPVKRVVSRLPSITSGNLPSINGGGSGGGSELPSIYSHKASKLRKMQGKSQLAPVGIADAPQNSSTQKKRRKLEERKIIKEQVKNALEAVREVFSSKRGKEILLLEARVKKAQKNDSCITCKVKRKDSTSSLGISFTIPARVTALGWESGQHLVITAVTKKRRSEDNTWSRRYSYCCRWS